MFRTAKKKKRGPRVGDFFPPNRNRKHTWFSLTVADRDKKILKSRMGKQSWFRMRSDPSGDFSLKQNPVSRGATLHRNHLRRYHVCPDARFPRGGPRRRPPLRQEGLRRVRAQGHLLRARRRPSRAGANSRNRRFPPMVAFRRACIRIDGDAGASVRARAAPIARLTSSVIPTSNDAPRLRATKPRPTPPRPSDGSRSEPSKPPTRVVTVDARRAKPPPPLEIDRRD